MIQKRIQQPIEAEIRDDEMNEKKMSMSRQSRDDESNEKNRCNAKSVTTKRTKKKLIDDIM